jgi:integrase
MRLFKKDKNGRTLKHDDKRPGRYYLDITINGQRYVERLGTTDKREAKKRALDRIVEIREGKATPSSINFAKLNFHDAADKYLAGRIGEIVESTLAKEKQLFKKPRGYFAGLELSKISVEQIRDYRVWRKADGAGNAIINMEVSVIGKLLKKAKRWHLFADEIKPLKVPDTIGRALEPEEKAKLLEVAAQRPEWETARWAMILAINTTMRPSEIKRLIWKDVDLTSRWLTIRDSKTEAGKRTIPLNDEAYEVLLDILSRAERFGPVEQDHYVFPANKSVAVFNDKEIVGRKYIVFDPTRPIGGWRRAWRNLRDKAGIKNFRFYDTRHHAITELGEAGVPEQTMMAIAGHVSKKMLDRYSHARMEAKRSALSLLNPKSHETIHGTKPEEPKAYSDVNVLASQRSGIGAWGFEPQTPTVSR